MASVVPGILLDITTARIYENGGASWRNGNDPCKGDVYVYNTDGGIVFSEPVVEVVRDLLAV